MFRCDHRFVLIARVRRLQFIRQRWCRVRSQKSKRFHQSKMSPSTQVQIAMQATLARVINEVMSVSSCLMCRRRLVSAQRSTPAHLGSPLPPVPQPPSEDRAVDRQHSYHFRPHRPQQLVHDGCSASPYSTSSLPEVSRIMLSSSEPAAVSKSAGSSIRVEPFAVLTVPRTCGWHPAPGSQLSVSRRGESADVPFRWFT